MNDPITVKKMEAIVPEEPRSDEAFLIVLKGKDENEKFALSGKKDKTSSIYSFGRARELSDYVVEDEKVSRCHFKIICRDDTYFLIDNGSSNGTDLNGVPVIGEVRLHNNDNIRAGDTFLKFLQCDIEKRFLENLLEKINKDNMTGAYNHGFFISYIEKYFAETRRSGRKFSVIAFDIDHFKKINDTFGHQAGDYVLTEMCKIISNRIRKSDILARMGGEEFNIKLPDTPLQNATLVADSIRQIIEDYTFEHEKKLINVTISMGIVEYDENFKSPVEILKVADNRLYAAKNSGRNRVVSE